MYSSMAPSDEIGNDGLGDYPEQTSLDFLVFIWLNTQCHECIDLWLNIQIQSVHLIEFGLAQSRMY